MDDESLGQLHPITRKWFRATFGAPTPAQQLAWPALAGRGSTLLLSPTGSGKTLAAFLLALDRLLFTERPPGSTTQVLYISPLKALGIDVERNLQLPLLGLRKCAEQEGAQVNVPTVAIRSGDTSPSERRALGRRPPDILITTPESLYLMLTSGARGTLTQVDCVIVDEIHSLCGNKRGAHLALSLERLEEARDGAVPLQRIGLSATQRPLSEIARFLGGFRRVGERFEPRPVAILAAPNAKRYNLAVRSPLLDAHRAAASLKPPTGTRNAAESPWESLYPELLTLIRAHRSTMIFVNSRRLAEKLAGALNDFAQEELVLAHHGSLSHKQRVLVEGRLKAGTLQAIVATSSLELGIDMGAVDLVVQVETPPSVASAIQRFGRAGHQVGADSEAIVFPKYRGDLLAAATIVGHVHAGLVESTRYPKNPLDVLAQHLIAMLVDTPRSVDDVFDLVRQAAPFAELPREVYESVLDMLSGRFPSERFRELRPRISWNRTTGELEARRGARLLACSNPGTIVDRGLYGVFLAGTEPALRVGELDEEMVFEIHPGDVFTLGASSWRVDGIDNDRVLVTPAPGEPGRMPFWRGDRPPRPFEFGAAIGALIRRLEISTPEEAGHWLGKECGLVHEATQALLDHVQTQAARGRLPHDRRIVIETFPDEAGDRVVILTPFGGQVHAPWALAAAESLRRLSGVTLDTQWTDEGIVFRLPEADVQVDERWLLPKASELNTLLRQGLGSTALFAARFRESATRALLLPRRRPGRRMPLWLQRRRAADLLSAAQDFDSFPMVLEAYRECLQDTFDVPALRQILESVEADRISVEVIQTDRPSPFASAVVFSYVGNFIYDGDAPPAERRAQALGLDQRALDSLLGEPALRELLDPEVLAELEQHLQRRAGPWPRDAAELHDLLRGLGDLATTELEALCPAPERSAWLQSLESSGQAFRARIGGEERWLASEDASRYRDALGIALPDGLPPRLLSEPLEPLLDIAHRFAETHGPFAASAMATRFGTSIEFWAGPLGLLRERGLVHEGAFLAGGQGTEFCSAVVLERAKRLTLAKVRKSIAPVSPAAYIGFLLEHQSIAHPGEGAQGALTAIEQLQGVELPYSTWMNSVFPARIRGFAPRDIDGLCASGEVRWRASGARFADARIAFFLTDRYRELAAPAELTEGQVAQRVRELLAGGGARFFDDLVARLDAFPGDVLSTLWKMALAGELTNDTLRPFASLGDMAARPSQRPARQARLVRPRRSGPPGSEGRWSLLPPSDATAEQRSVATVELLLDRYGVLTRDTVNHLGVPGGYAALYPVLRGLEDRGRVRRGFFIEGHGPNQFALLGVPTALRRHDSTEPARVVWLAAADPANPYGIGLDWPKAALGRLQRTAGAHVALVDGMLLAFASPGDNGISLTLAGEPERVAELIALLAESLIHRRSERPWLVETIDGRSTENVAAEAPPRPEMVEVGSPWAACQFLAKLRSLGGTSGSRGVLFRHPPLGPGDR